MKHAILYLPPFPLIKMLWQRLILDEVTDITNTNLISDDGNILYVVNSKFSNIQTHFIFYFRSVPQITNIHTSIGILRNETEPKLIYLS